MNRLLLVMCLWLFLGCEPGFDRTVCMDQCTQCDGIPCNAVCDELEAGFESLSCKDESQAVWTCALAEGCYFPTECEAEVTAFLGCR